MTQLYAVGETACNGVHGKNRLASNSLLESLVFAARAAKNITTNIKNAKTEHRLFQSASISCYQDMEALEHEYRGIVLNEIEKAEHDS